MKIDGKEVEAILMAGGQGFKIYGVNGDSLVVVAGRNKLVVKEADPDFKIIMRYVNLRYQNIDQHDQIKKDFQQIVSKMSDGVGESVDEWGIPMTEESELAKLKKAKKKLTDEERDEVMKAKAVWHHGPNGEETFAIWKAELNGKTYYCSNTHRAWSKSTTLKDAIKKFHEYTKESA